MGGILFDTNVLSELMRPKPAAEVLDWFEQQKGTQFFVSAITRAEILLGIALLPDGNCAAEYALLVAERTRCGHSISTEDGQIAAIALSHELPLATRNGKDFKGIAGLVVLNPWK